MTEEKTQKQWAEGEREEKEKQLRDESFKPEANGTFRIAVILSCECGWYHVISRAESVVMALNGFAFRTICEGCGKILQAVPDPKQNQEMIRYKQKQMIQAPPEKGLIERMKLREQAAWSRR